MFKNCCGCPSKKASRTESEEEKEENEEKKERETITFEFPRQKEIGVAGEKEKEEEEKEKEKGNVKNEIGKKVEKIDRKDAVKFNEIPSDEMENIPRRSSSPKRAKPRLSISAEVKIIPTNFPDDLEGDSFAEEAEETKRDEEERDDKLVEEDEEEGEEDGEDPESISLSVKNIDGKIIRRSISQEECGKISSSPEEENRPTSPLSDEVFGANEKSHLDLPLHNLGVKAKDSERTEMTIGSPLKKASALSQKRVSMPAVLPKWLSEEDETGGSQEPPVTPVARDELALRRHRFFSELLSVAQAANEHKVRFDPLGPAIEIISEGDQGGPRSQSKEFDNLLTRLEKVTIRLEKTVPLLEKGAELYGKNVAKSLEDLLIEERLITPTEKEDFQILINSKGSSEPEEGEGERYKGEEKEGFVIVSPDSSADFDELSDKELILSELEKREIPGSESGENGSENSINSPETVAIGSVEEEGSSENDEGSIKRKEIGDKFNGDKTEMTNSQSTLSMSVQGFQQVLQGPFASYLQVSAKIGGDVAEHAKIVQEAFQAQLQYLSLAAQSSKPSQGEEMKLLQPTSQKIEAIQNFREKHRTSNYFNHLSAISESIPALGWVTVSPAPGPYVKEMNDAGQFYTNRVLKDWKEKDKIHADWTKAWIQTLSELQAFVKQYHTTGLVWAGTSAAKMSGAPPPPPPGGMPAPPPMLFDLGDVAPGQDRSALFAEINQGENITRNLKKVTPDMQTHKNPAIRAGPAPFKPTPASIQNQVPKPFKASSPPEKPAKFAREGKKWFVEHQKGNHQLVVENAEMNNVVYVYKCSDSTLVVKGKVNSIFLDACKKTAVVFDSVVSSIEFVNCQSVQMQVLGAVPTISIDKTDGCQMYLSQDSMNVEIVSSKSSEMNVLIPTGSGEFKEFPIPEQYKTTVGKQGLTTIAVESKG